jgi:hypothetical protein
MGRNSGGVVGSSRYTPQEIENAIERYVRASGDVNGMFRRPDAYSSDAERMDVAKKLDSAMRKVNDDVLYRKLDASHLFGYMSYDEYDKFYDKIVYDKGSTKVDYNSAIGKTITDKGFGSTSKSRNYVENYERDKAVIMRINNKSRKARGIDIGNKIFHEDEVLLKRGTRYKIKKVYSKNYEIYVDVDLV